MQHLKKQFFELSVSLATSVRMSLPMSLSASLSLLALFFTIQTFAHDGHHDAPGSIEAPKGGYVRSLETIHLELLPDEKDRKMYRLYVYDVKTKDSKLQPLPAKNYPASAKATRPRKKSDVIKLNPKEDHWAFRYDAMGAHRFEFALTIEQGGHKDIVRWNIEPKKTHTHKKKKHAHKH